MEPVPENDVRYITYRLCNRYNFNPQEEQVVAHVEGCWCSQDDDSIDLSLYLKVLGSYACLCTYVCLSYYDILVVH